MTTKPEAVSYWFAYDSTAVKEYIKKISDNGMLCVFDCHEDARRFCRFRAWVAYKEVQYIRLTDHERLQAETERLQADHEAERTADKARIADLEAALSRTVVALGSALPDRNPHDDYVIESALRLLEGRSE